MWNMGSIAGIALLIQIVTGIILAMHYTPHVDHAFDSVEKIMHVNYGWLIRYMHAVGASMFFVAVYLHIFRGLYYGSCKAPETTMANRSSYIFNHDGNSFYGICTSLGSNELLGRNSNYKPIFSNTSHWRWNCHLALGGFSVDNPTLNRFFFSALSATIYYSWFGYTTYLVTSYSWIEQSYWSKTKKKIWFHFIHIIQ